MRIRIWITLCVMILSVALIRAEKTGTGSSTDVPPPANEQTTDQDKEEDEAKQADTDKETISGPDLTWGDRPVHFNQSPGEAPLKVGHPSKRKPGDPADKGKRNVDYLLAPIPFSNSTTGFGLAGVFGLIYPLGRNDTKSPPSITMVGGFYSENKSWGIGAIQRGYFKEDHYRFMVGGAYADANWDFTGAGGILTELGLSIPLNQKVFIAAGEFLFRLAPNIYLGPTFQFLDVGTTLRRENLSGGGSIIDEIIKGIADQLDVQAMSLGFRFNWDTRDNTFYPGAGSLFNVTGDFYRDTWGSDFNYEIYEVSFDHYVSLSAKDVIAFRGLGRFAYGDAPFFALSSMNLRGYAFGEYLDNLMVNGQVEYRRHLWWRIGLAAFVGIGEVAPEWSSFSWNNLLPSYGFGIRFRLTKDNPINLRIDFAFTKDSHAFLMGVGEAF